MTRRMLILVSAALLAFAPAAFAQDPEEALDDEPVAEATPTPGCERGPGTDADYVYCEDPCLDDESTDADYVYCVSAGSGGEPPPRPRRPVTPVQPLAAQQLPMTGGEPWLIAACGAGFLLAGGGLRLRYR